MPGETRAEKFHLVSQHRVVGQIQKLVLIGNKGYRQQLHVGFFRSAIGFTIITAPTGGNDIGPDIFATAGNGNDMIPRQFGYAKLIATIHTEIFVAAKQELVFQRWVVLLVMHLAVASNNTGEFEDGTDALSVVTTANFHHGIAEGPDNQVFYQKRCCLFPG